MPATQQRLYVYYRVAAGDALAAIEAVTALHVAWRESMPGLECWLQRRDEVASTPESTLMETYACADGLPAAWLAVIESQAGERLAPWLHSERHIERFTPCA